MERNVRIVDIEIIFRWIPTYIVYIWCILSIHINLYIISIILYGTSFTYVIRLISWHALLKF